MIKSSLTKTAQLACAFLLAGPMVGCGDDGGTSGDPPDAGIDAMATDGGGIDACVGGHGGGCIDSPFSLAEGGEFRLERFKYNPQNDDDLAAHAFFFRGQTPEFRELAGPEITLRAELVADGYTCHDMRRGDYFDNGFSAEAQLVADSRDYFDVGGARLTNADDATDVIELASSIGNADADATTDASASLQHDILFKGDLDTVVTLGARYLPEIDGSAEYGSLDLKYGQSASGDEMADSNGNGVPQVYMPAGFTMTLPTEADFYPALPFTKGEDTFLEYTIDNPEPVGGADGYPTIVPFIGFVDAGEVQAYCFKTTKGVLDDGKFTVPHEVLEILPAAPAEPGYIIFGRFTHVAWEVGGGDLTRMDFVGVECLISDDWSVAEADRKSVV